MASLRCSYFTTFASVPAIAGRLYYVGGPAVAFIPDVAGCHAIAVIAVAWRCRHFCCLPPCYCWRPSLVGVPAVMFPCYCWRSCNWWRPAVASLSAVCQRLYWSWECPPPFSTSGIELKRGNQIMTGVYLKIPMPALGHVGLRILHYLASTVFVQVFFFTLPTRSQ